MYSTQNILLFGLLSILLAPIAGGLITGLDRKLTARFQSRTGPPLMQPFYDVAKLWGKERTTTNVWIAFSAWVYVTASATTVFLFFIQSDLLLILFVQAVGAVFLCIGAFAVPSPFSQIGAQRELLQIFTYEPLLTLVVISMAAVTGSFKISDVLAYDSPLLLELPLMFIVLGYALAIKLRKSPFDISASAHAHQELVRGVYTEYSGRYLALTEIAHWYEVVFVLGLCALFWTTNWMILVPLLIVTYLVEIIVDNGAARMTWRWMLPTVWFTGLGLSLVKLT